MIIGQEEGDTSPALYTNDPMLFCRNMGFIVGRSPVGSGMTLRGKRGIL